jgi:hypothetical protein
MVNLKKGKTECMLFGTGKNLSKNDDHVLNIKLKEELVNNVTSYSYLGILLGNSIRELSGRVRLLWKLRQSMSMNSAAKVHNAMVMPVIMYCSLINPWSSTTRRSKLESLEHRVRSIIFQDENPSKLKVKISGVSKTKTYENEDRRPKMGLRKYENEDPLRKRRPTTKTKTHLSKFRVFRKRRPTKTKTEDLRWVFVITKTKTHYENEDPSLFSYYENEDPKIFIYIVFTKISVKVSRN